VARTLVPADFEPPEFFDAGTFRLRILGPDLLAKDYEAYMSSVEYLKGGCWGPDDMWPEGVTVEYALLDVCYTKMSYLMRKSFTYAVLDPDERLEVGCIYILPSEKLGYDAEVRTWVRRSEADKGFDRPLFEWARGWVESDWPFENVAYPGREIDWRTWAELTDKPL
jgi:hypothetical protein